MNGLLKSNAAPIYDEAHVAYFTPTPKPIKILPAQSPLELMFAYYESA